MDLLRRVAGEPALILGGPRALLMQIAHPKIAAAVAEHSDFREHAWLRLWRTLDAVLWVIFGTPAEGEAVVAAIHRVHDRVHGAMPESAGAWRRGARYTAHDRRAQVWVLATLADTAEVLFERFVRPLRPVERADLWADWRRFGLAFGIPDRLLPVTETDYRAYVAKQLGGGELEVGATARQLAQAILYPRLPLVPRGAFDLSLGLTAGLLPPALREAYGLPWGARERRQLAQWDRLNRVVWRLTPRARRRLPDVYVTLRRRLAPPFLIQAA